MEKIKILATNEKNNCIFWKDNLTIYHDYLNALAGIWRSKKSESILFNIKWAFRLFIKSSHYDVIITNADRCSLMFAIMQLIFRHNPKPHILLFVFWNIPDKGIKKYIRWIEYKIILKSVTKVIVFSRKQQSLHAATFDEPVDKFPFVPFHTTMRKLELNVTEGDYIFAGGDTGRDYKTLIEAIRGLPYKLIIAALQRNHFSNIDIPENVSIVTVNTDEFMQLIAGSRAMALPLYGGVLQAGGQQTFLNAMAMGKTVIIADSNSAEEYIENGVDGIIVEPKNISEMRDSIIRVMENKEKCVQMGEKAMRKAKQFPVVNFTTKVYDIATKLASNA